MTPILKKWIFILATASAFVSEAKDIALDGNLTEHEWKLATPIELSNIQYPYERDSLPVKTSALILPGDNHLYVAISADYEGPIKAYLNPLDKISSNDDFVQLIVRPYISSGDAYVFEFNAKGSKQDGTWQSRSTSPEYSWDGDWELATNIAEGKYTAELKIPYSNFNFDDSGDTNTWQIGVKRQYPNSKFHMLASYQYMNNQECEICFINKVDGFNGAKQEKTFFLQPAVVYRASSSEYGDDKTSTDKFEPSLEIEWKPSSNSNFNAGLNVDYSGSDIDALQIDINNPFALYFDEKRSTFTRDADVFSSAQSLIYTRNIISPEYGFKYTSQSDEQDLGFFYFKDNFTSYIVPGTYYSDSAYRNVSSNNFAAKIAKKNESGTLSLLTTVKESQGYRNSVLSLGGAWYINENNEVTLEFSKSNTHDEHFDIDSQDGHYSYLTYSLTGTDWSVYAEASVNDSFRSDLGFNANQDRTSLYGMVDKTFVPEENDWVYEVTVSLDVRRESENGGKTIEDSRGFYASVSLPNSSTLNYELLSIDTSPFEYDESVISVLSQTISVYANPTDNWEVYGSYTFGDWVDYINEQKGKNTIYTFGNSYQITESSDVFVDIKYDEMKTPGGDDVFGYWQYDFGVKYQVNDYSYFKINGSHYRLSEHYEEQYDTDNTVFQALYVYNLNNQVDFSMGMIEDRLDLKSAFELHQEMETRYFIKYTQKFAF